jgi:hypothetical protein
MTKCAICGKKMNIAKGEKGKYELKRHLVIDEFTNADWIPDAEGITERKEVRYSYSNRKGSEWLFEAVVDNSTGDGVLVIADPDTYFEFNAVIIRGKNMKELKNKINKRFVKFFNDNMPFKK